MTGIINHIGSKTVIINGTNTASAGTVSLSGITGLDYEEGTWDAVMTTTGTDYTFTGSRSTVGSYVKIGKMVIVTANPSIPSPSNGTGNFIITGLPFPASYYNGETSAAMGRVTLDQSGAKDYFTQLETGQTKINFYYNVSQAGVNALPASALNGNATPYLALTMTYFIQ